MRLYHKKTWRAGLFALGLCWGLVSPSKAQTDYTPIIEAIDSNAIALKAYQKSGDAQKMRNRTGLTPSDPEIEVNYIRPIGFTRSHLMDYRISQSIAFPTVYGHKKEVSDRQNELVDTDYRIFRADLINQAVNAYLNWIYYQQLGAILQQQQEYADGIASSYQKTFEAGKLNILDRNKAQINAVNARKEYELNAIEIKTAYQELMRYNKGEPFTHLSTDFPELPRDLAAALLDERRFLANNDQVSAAKQDVALSQAEEKLAKAESLPEFNVGYLWGQEFEANFRGVSLGMSIPLWQQKNTRKYARLQTQARKETQEDLENQSTLRINLLQERASELYQVLVDLQDNLSQTRNFDLLKKALQLQEITILEYLMEQSMYFELSKKYLETQLKFHSTLADLYRWEY